MNPPCKNPPEGLSRRLFITRTALAAGTLVFGVPTLLRGQNLNSKLNIVTIGAGGKGSSDTNCCDSENIIALCDADWDCARGQLERYPDAKFFHDYRKMFDALHKSIDAVIVSTPDHFHAVAAAAAMRLGKHVYCQKPLTQTIYEARYLRELAVKKHLVTQLGNQGSASDGLRRAAECLQAGLIGNAREIHVWTNRPVWNQGCPRPIGTDPIPENLDWDIWLGPAPARPFKKGAYHTFVWRGWMDFGTGALGDMACHTVNMPFRGLNLGHPTEIEAMSEPLNGETYPLASKIRFLFGPEKHAKHGMPDRPPVTLWWYDGGKALPDDPYRHDGSNKPPVEVTADLLAQYGEVPPSGCLIIGDKGSIYSPDDYGEDFFVKLTDDKKFVHYKKHLALEAIPQTITRNAHKGDNDRRHHQEWIAAIKANDPKMCYSRFEIGGQLTEIMLLGCVALRVGKKLEWDGPAMKVRNAPEARHFIKRDNRHGWKMA